MENLTRYDVLPKATEYEQMVVYYGYIVNRFVRIKVSFDGTYGRFEICLYHSQKEQLTGSHYYSRTYRGVNKVPDKYHAACVKMYAMARKSPRGQCKLVTQKGLDSYNV